MKMKTKFKEGDKFVLEICKDINCPECSFNKGEDGCLLAERLNEIKVTSEPCDEHKMKTEFKEGDKFVIEISKKHRPLDAYEINGGTWIKMSDADGDYYVCNQCGEELPRYTTKSPTWDIPYPTKYSIDKTNFCPNCGADMRGDK